MRIRNCLVLLTLLSGGLATLLLAHVSPINHLHFKAVSSAWEFKVNDGSYDFTMTWTHDVTDREKYTLVIKRDANASKQPISLYNLAVQGRRWDVMVDSAESWLDANHTKAGTVTFKDPLGGLVTGAPWKIPGTNAPLSTAPADDTAIYFLEFTGIECTLNVRVPGGHPTIGVPIQKDSLSNNSATKVSGHDGFPDPPAPGAEN